MDKRIIGFVTAIIICIVLGICLIGIWILGDNQGKNEQLQPQKTQIKSQGEYEETNMEGLCVYEGNNMKFRYDESLEITSRDQENCKNITINNSDGTMVLCSLLIQVDDMDEDAFFECFEDFARGRKAWKRRVSETGIANDQQGVKYYREYEILDIDNCEFEAFAQVQELENDYYLLTLAYLEEDFEENGQLARTIMDSIVYSDVESKGELELTRETSPLYQIHSFLMKNVDMNTEIYREDQKKELEEYHASIPADITLEEVEDYEYLRQRDIASADGNIYKIMVPRGYDKEYSADDKRFITYRDNGFYLGMYARLLFSEETLEDFLNVNTKDIYEDYENSELRYIHYNASEIFEEDGICYQIFYAERNSYDGEVIQEAELEAAIVLGGEDVLSFSVSIDQSALNRETKKYLEEIERYYGVPATKLLDYVEYVPKNN